MFESLEWMLGNFFRKFTPERGFHVMQRGRFHSFGPLPCPFIGTSTLEEFDLGSTYLWCDSLCCENSPRSDYWQATNFPNSALLVRAVGITPECSMVAGSTDGEAGLPVWGQMLPLRDCTTQHAPSSPWKVRMTAVPLSRGVGLNVQCLAQRSSSVMLASVISPL